MASLGSLAKKFVRSKKRVNARYYKKKHLFLRGAPFVKVSVKKVFEKSPKKPHSGKRACVQVTIKPKPEVRMNDFYGRQRFAFVTGTGVKKSVPPKGVILVRGGRRRDLPSVLYTVMRGKFTKSDKSYTDTSLIYGNPHRNARSKYGIMRPDSFTKRESDIQVGASRIATASLALEEDNYKIGNIASRVDDSSSDDESDTESTLISDNAANAYSLDSVFNDKEDNNLDNAESDYNEDYDESLSSGDNQSFDFDNEYIDDNAAVVDSSEKEERRNSRVSSASKKNNFNMSLNIGKSEMHKFRHPDEVRYDKYEFKYWTSGTAKSAEIDDTDKSEESNTQITDCINIVDGQAIRAENYDAVMPNSDLNKHVDKIIKWTRIITVSSIEEAKRLSPAIQEGNIDK